METQLDKEIIRETKHQRPLINIIVFLLAVFLLGAWIGYKAKYWIDQELIGMLWQ